MKTLNLIENNSGFVGTVSKSLTPVVIGIDSCAGVSCWPRDLCTDYPTEPTAESKAGVEYTGPSKGGPGIKVYGSRSLKMLVGRGHTGMKARVMDVRRPLLAMLEMADSGKDIHILHNGQYYAEDVHTGARNNFRRHNGILVMDSQVKPYTGE